MEPVKAQGSAPTDHDGMEPVKDKVSLFFGKAPLSLLAQVSWAGTLNE